MDVEVSTKEEPKEVGLFGVLFMYSSSKFVLNLFDQMKNLSVLAVYLIEIFYRNSRMKIGGVKLDLRPV